MTPKEKAEELVIKMASVEQRFGSVGYYEAIQCALVAVDEILNSEPRHPSNIDWDDAGGTHQYYYEAQREEAAKYWQNVKQELDKM
jgi:hypothetical protein